MAPDRPDPPERAEGSGYESDYQDVSHGQCKRSYPKLPPTPHQLDGAVAAAEHLLGYQLPPIFDLPTIRMLWRRGDRKLALTLAKIRGVA